MTYITLGQFSIPITWIAFFIAIFYSDFRSKNKDENTDKIISRLFWFYVIIWKLSYIIFSWESFVQAPMSILYFDGGLKGNILAFMVMMIVLVKHQARIEWEVLWQYWTRFIAAHQFVTYILMEQWVIAIIWLALLLVLELKQKQKQWILVVQWPVLLWVTGWLDALVMAHLLVILSLIVKKKNYQHIALVGVLSLMAMTVTELRATVSTSDRVAIDLNTTSNDRYILSEKDQKLTVVNFFATWCPPCQAEMPHLQNFAENLPDQVELIGVNLTDRDNGTKALAEFMTTYEVSYPILLDEKDRFGRSYNIVSIPTTVLLNKDGQELERIIGPVSEEVLRNLANKYK